ncbi:hypothetical protein [Nocardioides psychrotolerans]|uniref:hypothetical protein n=1 Tax=Nocardioides psychrotolerans TaxID=1005945 RepID=UPI003137DEA5
MPGFHKLVVTAEKQCLRGVPLHRRGERRVARGRARVLAEAWATDLQRIAKSDREARQSQLDMNRAGLLANDGKIVIATLIEHFASVSRRISVSAHVDGEIGLIVPVSSLTSIPAQKPALTPLGHPTLHKLSQTERNEWYAQIIAAEVLLAAKEALSIAVGTPGARIVAVDGRGVSLLAARVSSQRLSGADWSRGAWSILSTIDPQLRCDARGRTLALHTIDLRRDPEFGPLIRQ